MSLTNELRNPESPVSGFFRDHAIKEAATRMVSAINDRVAGIAPSTVEGADPASVGRAFDYAYRWHVRSFSQENAAEFRAALTGAKNIGRAAEVRELIHIGNASPELRAACCVALGYFEEVYRSGKAAPLILSPAKAMVSQLEPSLDAQDVEMLVAQIHDELLNPEGYIANPGFAGSVDVGGADGDWIINGTLYDCKCSRIRRPMKSEYIWQIFGYVLLDYDDQYKLNRVGWYFARQSYIARFSLESILPRLFHNPDLSWLRKEFKKAVNSSG